MFFASKSPSQKRKDLGSALRSGRLLRFPGSFSPLVSMLIEEVGFDGVYISGAVLSSDLGLPDIGLTTLSEVSARGHVIARSTGLPAIIDLDTGFGDILNVARSIREVETQGLCGAHIEDQVNPKRCGHLDHKELIETGVMSRKIKAAVDARTDSNFLVIARTDAPTVEGIDRAIGRARAYVDAGADMIFPEALRDEKEFEQFRKAVDVPLLANMTEFGKSELLTHSQLQNLGYSIVIYPVTAFRLAMKAVEDGLTRLLEDGNQAQLLPKMQRRKRLYEILRYEGYNLFDKDIFNFKLS